MIRTLLLLCAFTAAFPGWGQELLINEVQPANRRTIASAAGEHADWVELRSRSRRPIDLRGYTLSLGARSHRFPASLEVPAGGCLLLWCDGHAERGPDHVDLRLPREGGTLLLIAADGTTVLDVFTWSALPADVSIGRTEGTGWCLFPTPTPGRPNGPDTKLRRSSDAPPLRLEGDRIVLDAPVGGTVRCTRDGAPVGPLDTALTDGMALGPGQVLRARTYTQGALPGPESVLFHTPRPEPAGYVHLMVEEPLLFGDSLGILAVNDRANFSRSGKAWQVPALAELVTPSGRQLVHVGLAVAGSGSRSLPKRSFKLLARDRFGSEGLLRVPGRGDFDEVIVRADAGPSAYLRNVFMEQVVQHAGGLLDEQAGTALPLYLNGRYQGLYRLLPPKNADRFAQHGESVDLVDGPAARSLRGSARTYVKAVEALHRGAPLDSLEQLMQVESLVELACMDLYSGRADHDLNMRAWRPHRSDGRWRWVLFDMDLWGPPGENAVDRMCAAQAPEAPYLGALLGHPDLRPRLVARLEALLLTILSPIDAASLVDSIAAADAEALERDQARWAVAMDRPSPVEVRTALLEHVRQRPDLLLGQLAGHLHQGRSLLVIDAPDPAQGRLLVEDLELRRSATDLPLLRDVPLRITAEAAPGWEFAGWRGAPGRSPVRSVIPGREARVTAMFRPAVIRP